MKKKEIIKQIIRDFHLSEKFDVIPRDIELPVDSGKIITVIGVRRCGKTSLLYELINTLSDTIDKEQILYFNFEDERLNFQADELDLLLQAYSELYPQYDLARCYFFFDKIQNSLSEGGFSELIFINKEHALPVLQEYYNVLIYKDIVERYHVNNTVALKYFLKRVLSSTTKQISVLYYKTDKSECDFICFDREKAMIAIQVTYDMSNEKTRQREITGLLNACQHFALKSGIIITYEDEDELSIDNIHIKLIPFFKMADSFQGPL